jgi:hypothetical protein
VLLRKYYSANQINEDQMGRAYGNCGEEEKYIQNFGGGNLMERNNLEGLGVDLEIILKWGLKK